MEENFIFEKLDVWKKAKQLVLDIYPLIGRFPDSERYSLCDQLRRSAISVPSNIAEGSGRASVKEKIHFIEIAYGSLMESFCQLCIAVDLHYIKEEELKKLKVQIAEVAKMLSGWRNNLRSKL